MFIVTDIVVILFVTTVMNLFATYISWQRRKTRSGLYFALGMLGVTFWTLTTGFDYAAVSIPLKVFFAKLEYTGYNMAFLFFALFVLSYTGYEDWLEKRSVRAFFLTITASNILLVWTNDWHGWLWSGFRMSEFGDNTAIFEHGPGYLWAAITGYLMILIIIAPLWQASRKGSKFSRRQARLLFLASLVPIIGNLFYLFQTPELRGVDWTPITFSISSLLFLVALYGTRLLDLTPIARDKLMAGLSDGMIVLDNQDRIIDINLAAADMIRVSSEDLIGNKMPDSVSLAQVFSAKTPEQEIRTELEIGDANKHYFDVLVSPLRERNRTVVGRLIIFRDITERKKNELRLLQLTQAIEQSPSSVVVTDHNGIIEYVNPHFSKLTGYSYEEAIGKNPSILKSGKTPVEVYRDMWQVIQAGKVWKGEFLNRKKSGELYWEDATMAPVLDRDGRILNFIAVKADITERKHIEDILRASEERFRQLVTSAPDVVFGVDVDGNIVFANREASNLLGYENEELLGRSVEMFVPPGLQARHVSHRKKYFTNPRTRMMGMGLELTARRKDGTEVPVEINLSHSITDAGPLVIAFMRDITDRKQVEDALRDANQQLESQLREIEKLQASLREQAIRDPLTHLYNRRFLNESIGQEFHHAKRASEALSIILLDIDHFKAINDTYGHAIGDACIVALANLLERHIRRSDICCRYGGEEFMLVLPATNIEGAARHAEKLRRLVADAPLIIDGQEIRYTISLGVSSYPADGMNHNEIIKTADDAMYISKRTGRNRVTVWSQADADKSQN